MCLGELCAAFLYEVYSVYYTLCIYVLQCALEHVIMRQKVCIQCANMQCAVCSLQCEMCRCAVCCAGRPVGTLGIVGSIEGTLHYTAHQVFTKHEYVRYYNTN